MNLMSVPNILRTKQKVAHRHGHLVDDVTHKLCGRMEPHQVAVRYSYYFSPNRTEEEFEKFV